jgi:hypothetical protein
MAVGTERERAGRFLQNEPNHRAAIISCQTLLRATAVPHRFRTGDPAKRSKAGAVRISVTV